MVECCHQADMPRKQHAVAEYIARHIAHTGDSKVRRLSVEIDFAEVPLDAFPGTFGGNTHFFMVIAN